MCYICVFSLIQIIRFNMYYHHHRFLFMHCRAGWLGNYEYERGIPLLSIKVDPALSMQRHTYIWAYSCELRRHGHSVRVQPGGQARGKIDYVALGPTRRMLSLLTYAYSNKRTRTCSPQHNSERASYYVIKSLNKKKKSCIYRAKHAHAKR